MAKKKRTRKRLEDNKQEQRGAYFLTPSKSHTFIHSGSCVLDSVLGGGWPLGRISNIIGDKSTGKTLLAIEAMTNFARAFPNKKIKIRYAEAESAFDDSYAEALGMPLKRVRRPEEPLESVERFYDDLKDYVDSLHGEGYQGLYILDSLDALSDQAELDRDLSDKTYGTNKAAKLSEMFRKITGRIEQSNCHVMIISQIRDNIGATFGRKYKRSGGKALDFYASQIIYLAHIGQITHTRNKIKRPVGVNVKVQCTKNKISMPFRQCEFPILFGYGIEDITASIDWLMENNQTQRTGLTQKELKEIKKKALRSDLDDVEELREELSIYVTEGWAEVESTFLPKKRKYN